MVGLLGKGRSKMANSADVLREIKHLIGKLYGENGFDGDIPEIKNHLKAINGHLDDHSKRLTIAETQLAERTSSKVSKKAVAGYGGGTAVVVSTLVLAIGQIMGWW